MLMSISALAGNSETILKKIEGDNATMATVDAAFVQTRTLPATGKQIHYEGHLCFSSPDRMSMVYTVPDTDIFLINGTTIYMVRDGRKGLYDTTKNPLMQSLGNTLCSCVLGKLTALAADNDADIEASEIPGGYRVTLTARTKGTKGYSRIVAEYDAKTTVLTLLELTEFSGISNLYEMSSIKRNTLINNEVYNIPK